MLLKTSAIHFALKSCKSFRILFFILQEISEGSDKKYVEALVFLQLLQNFFVTKKNNTNMFSSHCFLANVDSKGLLIAVFLQLNCMHTNIVTSSGYMNSVRVWFLFYQTRFYGASFPPPSLTCHLPSQGNLGFCYWLELSFLPYILHFNSHFQKGVFFVLHVIFSKQCKT